MNLINQELVMIKGKPELPLKIKLSGIESTNKVQ